MLELGNSVTFIKVKLLLVLFFSAFSIEVEGDVS